MPEASIHLLDTTPRWLGLTFGTTAFAFVIAGVGLFTYQLFQIAFTPFTLLAHFAVALSVSAWILNLRIKLRPDRKSLLALGIVIALGSIWSSMQQWYGYMQTGVATDLTLIAGAMMMDVAGGCVTYILFHINLAKK